MRRYTRKICAIAAGIFFIGEVGVFPVYVSAREQEATVRQTETAQESEKQNTQDSDEKEPDKENDKIYLGIDNRHVYEGMNQSFSNGYRPTVEENTFTVIVPFTVSGTLKDDKITVDLEYPTGSEHPFEQKNYQKDVKAGKYLFDGEEQRTFLYQLTGNLKKNAKAGQYPLTIKATAYNLQGEKTELECTVFINIEETENNSQDETENNGQGGNGENNGAGDKDGIGNGNGTENPPDDQNPEEGFDGELNGEEQEDPVSGGGYESLGGGSEGGSSEEILRQPKMLLESCNLSGIKLDAGSSQKMTTVFRNRSTSNAMYNLKVVASTEADGIKLDKKSWYFDSVGANKEITLENELKIQQDAAQGDVVITYTFEYEDKKGNSAAGTETLDLSVRQPVQLELEAEDIPTVVYATDTIELSMKALNLSRTGVYNVRIQLEGTGLFPTEEIFIGNMEAGTESEGTMRVYVGTKTMEAIGQDTGENDTEKYGETGGTITLLYEDADGEVYEETKEYRTEIKKPQIVSLTVEEEKEANSWWISVAAAVFIGMMAAILLLTGMLRKKAVLLREAEMTFEENK